MELTGIETGSPMREFRLVSVVKLGLVVFDLYTFVMFCSSGYFM